MSSSAAAFPTSTAVPLRGGPTLRWGVLAPGRIAESFVGTLHANSGQRVYGVASRSAERAADFAARHGIPTSFESYEALVGDPDIDIVYIAAPHSEHRVLALLAIAAGKHVLVEKPMAVSAAEAGDIITAARAAGVFALEALWTRFLPQSTVMRQLIDNGELGDIRLVSADFGFNFEYKPEHRLFNPALGGGALLDLGVYPLWFSHFALGAPEAVHASGTLAATGVDEQVAVTLDYAGGAQALVSATMRVHPRRGASIAGTRARIDVDPSFHGPGGFALVRDFEPQHWADEQPYSKPSDGLVWQAVAAAQHVADGLTEAPEHPLDATIAIMDVIDSARRQVGYPPE